MFVKKAIHTWRNRVVTFVQLLLPVIFTILGLLADEARPTTFDEPALNFNLGPFSSPKVPYTAGKSPDTISNDLATKYSQQFSSGVSLRNFDLDVWDTMDNYTLSLASSLGTSTFNKEVIIGAEFQAGTTNATAFFNGQPYHAMPIAVNMLMNALVKYTLNDSYGISSGIHPLPKNAKDSADQAVLIALSAGFSVGFCISFGMAFLTTMFIYFLIKERQVGAKHMQVVSGVGPVTYWLSTFLWDFINYIVPSLLLLVVFLAFQKQAYVGDDRAGLVVLILVVYGWAILPAMYALQFAFTSPPTGIVFVILLNIFSGLVTTLAVFVLQIPGLHTEDIADALNWIFMVLFPNFNMARSFMDLYSNYLYVDYCEDKNYPPQCWNNCTRNCVDFKSDYLDWESPGIGAYIFFMFVQGCFFIVVFMLIEYHVVQKIWYFLTDRGDPTDTMTHINQQSVVAEDSDVANERQRINSSPASVLSDTDSLLLVNLFKRYGNFVAVDHICVGVPDQECFGLLGQNGAGKTTTFKMLTGDIMVTGGNAYLKGFDVRNDIKNVQANMGYCPQFDALIDQMTGRETLVMYARLRGVPEESIKKVVNSLIDILMLRPHADKLAGHYSGGNKRKLSTAIALVGDPPFIMLDEPSSGMDPKARRQLWNVLSQVRASGRTLVLTSHSMEECDALCTRIAIMVNGSFMCLGSPQHLKNKFGQGYTLIAQLGTLPDGSIAPNEPLIDFIHDHFQSAKVFDDHQGYVHFQVPDRAVQLADVFSVMEETKTTLHVEDYSVHQTTLEQVFLSFTRNQVSPKENKGRSALTRVCCAPCIACGCLSKSSD